MKFLSHEITRESAAGDSQTKTAGVIVVSLKDRNADFGLT